MCFIRIIVLSDNNAHPEINLLTEHGLSIYIEFREHKYLLDVGASDKFYLNTIKMGVDISDIDYLVLSHGHNDHTGGLDTFMRINKKAKIFISENIKGKEFLSYRLHPAGRNIGIDSSIPEQNSDRFVFVKQHLQIARDVFILSGFPSLYAIPKANEYLFQKDLADERPDDFKHEIALVVKAPKGIIIFSSCSHNGILNILHACSDYFQNQQIVAYIGGLHLIDSDYNAQFETELEIANIGEMVKSLFPGMKLFTGHCTGQNAQKILSGIMGDNFSNFYTGATLEF